MRGTKFCGRYPAGSIRYTQELLDLLEEAKTEKTEITLYSVQQMGFISKYIICPESEFILNSSPHLEGPGFNKITCWTAFEYEDRSKWLFSYFLLGSYCVDDPMDNCGGEFRLFTSEMLAKKYAVELVSDSTYVKAVKAHHEKCERLFDSEFWRNVL